VVGDITYYEKTTRCKYRTHFHIFKVLLCIELITMAGGQFW